MKTFFFNSTYSLATVLSLTFVLPGCATTTASLPPVQPAMHTVEELTQIDLLDLLRAVMTLGKVSTGACTSLTITLISSCFCR